MEFKPKKYRLRTMKKRQWLVEAVRVKESNVLAIAIYQWVEQNSGGSFDVNFPTDPIPTSGVSIDAATGKMVIATPTGILPVDVGDWVVRLAGGDFTVFDARSFRDTYVSV